MGGLSAGELFDGPTVSRPGDSVETENLAQKAEDSDDSDGYDNDKEGTYHHCSPKSP